jgi:hypothetical protein
MAGDPAKTAVWGGADVLIGSLTATIPASGAPFTMNETSGGTAGVTTEWDFVGLLNGDDGFTENIEADSTDHNAWGYGVVATTYQGQKVTKTFTALEDNEVVMNLVYDASGVTFNPDGTYTGVLKVKDYTEKVKIAFVTTSGDSEKRRISHNYATIMPDDAGSESETALQSKGFTATIVPSTDKSLWFASRS